MSKIAVVEVSGCWKASWYPECPHLTDGGYCRAYHRKRVPDYVETPMVVKLYPKTSKRFPSWCPLPNKGEVFVVQLTEEEAKKIAKGGYYHEVYAIIDKLSPQIKDQLTEQVKEGK